MKILHCCLAQFYIDDYGYQENVMTRIHKHQGHDVYILASTETMDSKKGLVYVQPSSYINEDGIPVYRIPYIKYLPHFLSKKLRIYNGVEEVLNKISPDIIFMHDGQTSDIYTIKNYLKCHPNVKLYMDSHTDFVNSARNWLSSNILHKIIYKRYIQAIVPYVRKFYGTLPARVDFYRNVYCTPENKTEYLPMGVDDISINFQNKRDIKTEVRNKLGLNNTDFVIVSGGKLEQRKNVLTLIKAFMMIKSDSVKLLLFGSVKEDIKEEFFSLIEKDNRIVYVGWIPAKKTYELFFASDLACFPGTHSTLWEESVGYGIPAIFKYWKGITQIDLGENCMIISEDISNNVIKEYLCKIISNKKLYERMKYCAETKGHKRFSYSYISEYAISQ